MNFYLLGVPHTVIIDDYLPLMNNSDGTLRTIFASVSPDSALWVPLLEKAFAKLYGNYSHIEAGRAVSAINAMTGSPWDIYRHADAADKNVLWNTLWQLNKEGRMMNTSSQGHAYSVMDLKLLSNGTRLVKVFNPWASDSFSGKWSDTSAEWTDALKLEAGLD